MKMKHIFLSAIAMLLAMPGSLPCQAQAAPPQTVNDWLNEELQAKINQRSNTKQTETPSQSASSTTLVDQSSATDLISAALNLAGVNGDTGNGTTPASFSATASAYSIYALTRSHDPLDATFYNQHSAWRRLSITLGQDNGSTTGTSTTPRATTAGLKLLIVDKRDLSKQDFSRIFGTLQAATAAYGKISTEVSIYLVQNQTVQERIVESEWKVFLQNELTHAASQVDQERINGLLAKPLGQLFDSDTRKWTREEKKYFTEFQNNHLGATFQQTLQLVGDSGANDIHQIINRRIDIFPSLDRSIREKIEEIRRAPQFSIAFTSSTRPANGPNEYVAEAIFDYGVANRLNLTLNDTFNYKDTKVLGGITRGSKFVGDLKFQITPEKQFSGRAPVTFDAAVEGDWMTKVSPTYKGQLKVKVPIADGIDLPLSVTFANRTDLINEKDVVGKFGFTFDTAKLFSFLSK